jgi:hypothetical protein
VTSWTEVVTTALLGTDRRPLPADLLPAASGRTPVQEAVTVLLDHAARHRAAERASPPLPRCPPPPVAPADDRPCAPAPAQDLLARLLGRPDTELVNAWLAAAATRGVRAAPEHWTDLAALAATRPGYDRGLLSRALGPQGVWFLEQNPAWSRLAEALRAVGAAAPAGDPAPLPGEAEVRGRPEVALDVPAPWPRPLTLAALRVLVSGQLGWRASRYGSAVGSRVATPDHDLLQQALDALADVPERTMPGLRLVREAVLAAVAAAQTRAEIEQVFDRPAEVPEEREWS